MRAVGRDERAHEMKVCTGRGKIPCVGLAETEREELIQAPDRDPFGLEFTRWGVFRRRHRIAFQEMDSYF